MFQLFVLEAAQGEQPLTPMSPADWALLDRGNSGCEKAASNLFDAACDVKFAIEDSPIRDLQTVDEFVRNYCWRFKSVKQS